jgi:4-aminobutyrate--pyruvate transaminase
MRVPSDAARLQAAAQAEGLFVRAVGGDTVAICPPLILSDREMEWLFQRLGQALKQLATEPRR